jgi:hypothetical protein
MNIPVRVLGMAWFRSAEDYAWFRREFIDGDGFSRIDTMSISNRLTRAFRQK